MIISAWDWASHHLLSAGFWSSRVLHARLRSGDRD